MVTLKMREKVDVSQDMSPKIPINEEDIVFPRPLKASGILWAAVVAAAALACIPFSVPIYRFTFHLLRHLHLSSFYSTLVQFPSPTSVLIILGGIFFCQPRRRPTIIVFIVALLMTSIISRPINLLTARARPRYSVIMGEKERNWIIDYRTKHPDARMRPEQVDQWLGPGKGRPFYKDGYSSFPSGHASSSFVLASYLSALFPEARIVWYVAAGGCAAARVAKERHWPEDVIFGAALGWTVAHIVFSWRWPMLLGLWLKRRRSKQ